MKRVLSGLILTLALVWARPAAADTIAFDFEGDGCVLGGDSCVQLEELDWLPGNTMIIEATPTSGTILYQANLNTLVLVGPNLLNGDPYFYTATAEFSVTLNGDGTFDVVPGGVFTIYANLVGEANDLAGTGFTAGSIIWQGGATIGSGNFTFGGDVELLDQKDADNWGGQLTLIPGDGGSQITVLASTIDNGFFPTLNAGSSLSFTNTSLIDPFRTVDPTGLFFNGQVGVPSIDGINGLTSNIMAQADANTTFEQGETPEVPEPATLTLLGLGLLGSAAARRRQLKKKREQQQ